MRQAMIDTVDEVGRAAAEAGVACDYAKGGTIVYARSEPSGDHRLPIERLRPAKAHRE